MKYVLTWLFFSCFWFCSAAGVKKGVCIDSTATGFFFSKLSGPKRNILKVGPMSLILNNYSVSFERAINDKFSVQVAYRYQPYGYLFDNVVGRQLAKRISVNPEYYNFQTSNNALTVDFKYYPGSNSMNGFYVGVYGRLALFDLDNVDYAFKSAQGSLYSVPLVSNFKGIGGGISIGRQWIIKKVFTVEYYILALHYGGANGSLKSNKDLSYLNAGERADLKANVEDLFTISGKRYLSATVSDNGISGVISGPFVGIRAGINLGFAF